MTFGSHLGMSSKCRELLDGFAPPRAFADIHNMSFDQFFSEFNVNTARQTAFSIELQMRVEYLL